MNYEVITNSFKKQFSMSKKIIMVLMTAVLFTACNQKSDSNSEEVSTAVTTESAVTPTSASDTSETGNASVKDILTGYLKIKDAFANDDDKSAADAGNEMVTAFEKFDKSKLSAEQSKIYADIEDDAREHAEHIGKNAGNIKHQREHFEMLSKDMYQLVKTFGAGQQLYYDYCPMYNDGKGGNWLSQAKVISNPYMGKKMATCGSVKEELK